MDVCRRKGFLHHTSMQSVLPIRNAPHSVSQRTGWLVRHQKSLSLFCFSLAPDPPVPMSHLRHRIVPGLGALQSLRFLPMHPAGSHIHPPPCIWPWRHYPGSALLPPGRRCATCHCYLFSWCHCHSWHHPAPWACPLHLTQQLSRHPASLPLCSRHPLWG